MKNKRAIVISGGGSQGAFAGGIVDYLISKEKVNYDMYVSSSTGTLDQLISATGNISKLKLGYTKVSNGDIWKINPFKVIKSQNGKIKTELNWWNIIRNLSPSFKLVKEKKLPWFKIFKNKGSVSFGDSSNLLLLIKKFISQKEYLRIKDELEKELVVCVVNTTLKKIEYKSSLNWGYDDFCEWTQASCSAYPFMSPVYKSDYQYIDGGTLQTTPIQEAINRGATEIDVIILKEENPRFEVEYIRNLFHGILSQLDMMHCELSRNDVRIGKLKTKDEEVLLNFYHTPRKLTNNSLVFDKETMRAWWEEGYEFAKAKNFKTYKIVKGRKARLIKKIN